MKIAPYISFVVLYSVAFSLTPFLPWILSFLLQARAELLHYDYNEVIIQEGDQPNGIYLIVSGMVRVSLNELKGSNLDVCFTARIKFVSPLFVDTEW